MTVACFALAAALPARAAEAQADPDPAQLEAAAEARPAGPPGVVQEPPGGRSPDPREGPDERPDWAEPGSGESLVGALVRMLLVLALVIAIIYLTLNFGLRRLVQSPRRHSVVTVHERVPLEPKKTVYVVEAAGEYLLLGVGEHEVSLLAQLDKERAQQALARKQQSAKASSRPFWQRLTVKPPPRKPEGGEPS